MQSKTSTADMESLRHSAALPFDPGVSFYVANPMLPRPWEYNGWKPESLSWKKSCYIHGGLSGVGQLAFRGPGATKFLSSIAVNSFAKFPVGSAKHAVMCNDRGLIAGHGIVQRYGEDEYRTYFCTPWAPYMLSRGNHQVEMEPMSHYLFQVAGPASLQVLEAATGDDLHDLAFLRFRQTRINGRPVEVIRMGMSGTLGYELKGPLEEGPEIYEAVVLAGARYGIERLGWRTYTVNHVEGGFPQNIWTFNNALFDDPGLREFIDKSSNLVLPVPEMSGSIDPLDIRARYRTPHEVGWEKMVKFDHCFVGRAALEKEFANPRRTIRTLEWNADDVVDIYASNFRDSEEYKFIEFPTSPHLRGVLAHADAVHHGGEPVGVSSGTTYSFYYRKIISLCTLDIDVASIGQEVAVQWGDFGRIQKTVRATVSRFPYLDADRNQTIDTSQIPSGRGKWPKG